MHGGLWQTTKNSDMVSGIPASGFFNIIIIFYKWYAIILWVFYCLTIVLEANIQQKISEKIKLPTAHDKNIMYGNTFMP